MVFKYCTFLEKSLKLEMKEIAVISSVRKHTKILFVIVYEIRALTVKLMEQRI